MFSSWHPPAPSSFINLKKASLADHFKRTPPPRVPSTLGCVSPFRHLLLLSEIELLNKLVSVDSASEATFVWTAFRWKAVNVNDLFHEKPLEKPVTLSFCVAQLGRDLVAGVTSFLLPTIQSICSKSLQVWKVSFEHLSRLCSAVVSVVSWSSVFSLVVSYVLVVSVVRVLSACLSQGDAFELHSARRYQLKDLTGEVLESFMSALEDKRACDLLSLFAFLGHIVFVI